MWFEIRASICSKKLTVSTLQWHTLTVSFRVMIVGVVVGRNELFSCLVQRHRSSDFKLNKVLNQMLKLLILKIWYPSAWQGIDALIVSITKFLIVFGHLRTYFLCYWRTVTWVSNYSYPITTFCNWIALIGHLHCMPFTQMCTALNWFFFPAVSLQVSNW